MELSIPRGKVWYNPNRENEERFHEPTGLQNANNKTSRTYGYSCKMQKKMYNARGEEI